MRIEVLGPGHVLLTGRRAGRWFLLGLAVLLTLATGWGARTAGLSPPSVIAVFLVVLLLGGTAAALAFRTEIELDRHGVRIRRRRLFTEMELAGPRGAVQGVAVVARIVSGSHGGRSQHRSMVYAVELRLRGEGLPAAEPLLQGAREPSLRRFAERLCAAAGVPFIDAVGEEAVVREPGALAGPPMRRLAMPAGGPPDGLEILADPGRRPVARTGLVPPSARRVLPVVAGASLAATILAGFVFGGGTPMGDGVLLVAMTVGEGLVLTFLAWLAVGRAEVYVADGELHCVARVLGMPLQHRRMLVAAIENVRVQARDGAAPHLHEGVAVVGDRQVLLVGRGLELEGRRWLRGWLEHQLWPAAAAEPAADVG